MSAIKDRYLYDYDVSFGPTEDTWATRKMEKSYEAVESISKLIPDRKVAEALARLIEEHISYDENAEILANFFDLDEEKILALGKSMDKYADFLAEEEKYRREEGCYD